MRTPLMSALALLLAACGGAPDTRRPSVSEQDRQTGAEQHPQLLAEFGGAYDGPESAYVSALGEKMAATAQLDGQCTFTLVNSDVVNAFAVPGCYIYITRGLMGIVNSEAELASVLGHELGHIVAAHSSRQQNRSIWRSVGVAAVGILTGSEGLTRIAGAAAQYFGLRYSRAQEYESDTLGIRYLRAAGYDPYAAADMLTALGAQERFLVDTSSRDEARSIPEWVRTHPLTANRIERARSEARKSGLEPDALPENEAAYLTEVDGLLYGDDPKQGFVIGRRFAHPIMRIGFEAPDGYTLTNSPQAILINGPEGVRGEFAGGRMPPGGIEPYASGLLEQMLGQSQAQVGQAERVMINGLRAVIVPVRVATREGDGELTLAAYEGGGGSAYHFLMLTPPSRSAEASLGELFRSFRLLTDADVRQLRPRVIRVVTAQPGDTEASLAGRMASDHPVETWRMINGRESGTPLRPGERVKVLAYAGS